MSKLTDMLAVLLFPAGEAGERGTFKFIGTVIYRGSGEL